jgi:serine/threonine-protein kinase
MGEVFLAHDPDRDQLVAIKLLKAGFDQGKIRERLAREACAAATLSHSNIATVLGFGVHEGQSFLVREYIPGDTLADLIGRREPLPLNRRLQLLEDLCAGLVHAHRAEIPHLHVKPANLIIAPGGVLKIVDFGLGRVFDSTMMASGVGVGTANYMSPEQIIGRKNVDHRSDAFSVAAVAYELLSFEQAFPGAFRDVFVRLTHGHPRQLSSLCPGLDPAIERIVEQGLEKDPERRYQDLERMRQDIVAVRQRLGAAQLERIDGVGARDAAPVEEPAPAQSRLRLVVPAEAVPPPVLEPVSPPVPEPMRVSEPVVMAAPPIEAEAPRVTTVASSAADPAAAHGEAGTGRIPDEEPPAAASVPAPQSPAPAAGPPEPVAALVPQRQPEDRVAPSRLVWAAGLGALLILGMGVPAYLLRSPADSAPSPVSATPPVTPDPAPESTAAVPPSGARGRARQPARTASRTVPAAQASVETTETTGPGDGVVAAYRERTRLAVRRGDQRAILQQTVEGLDKGDDEYLRRVLGELTREARNEAAAAAARATGASTTSFYEAAARTEQEALRLHELGAMGPAVERFWDAARLYRQAVAQVRAEGKGSKP